MRIAYTIIALVLAVQCCAVGTPVDSVRVDTVKTLRDSLFTPFPDMMLDEVVVTAPRLDRTGVSFHIDAKEAQLMQSQPAGFNPLALVGWVISKIVGPRHKMTQRERLKKALDNY